MLFDELGHLKEGCLAENTPLSHLAFGLLPNGTIDPAVQVSGDVQFWPTGSLKHATLGSDWVTVLPNGRSEIRYAGESIDFDSSGDLLPKVISATH